MHVQVVALGNLLPLDNAVDELDSWMFQTVGHQLVAGYAAACGLPLLRRRIRGTSRHTVSCLLPADLLDSWVTPWALTDSQLLRYGIDCRSWATARLLEMRWRTWRPCWRLLRSASQ